MKICMGEHRIVLLIGQIAIKIPRVKIISRFRRIGAKTFWNDSRFELKMLWRAFSTALKENIREFRLYRKTKHPLLNPTYFSLWILNISKRTEGVGHFNFESDQIYYELWESGEREFVKDMVRLVQHTFDWKDNFSLEGSKVRVVDYGEDGFPEFLAKYGDRIEGLLLNYAAK